MQNSFLNGGFKPFNEYNWTETEINIKDKFLRNFNTFNQYNFTVQEEQNFDADVAVDPEMLGVFENFLFKKERIFLYSKKVVTIYVNKVLRIT